MNNKTRAPRQSRSIQTRERLIVAALELFSEKGYHSTNSKEIAARSGVAIGSFYAYFEDKKELFIETFKYHAALIEKSFSTQNMSENQNGPNEDWNNVWKNLPSSITDREKIKIILTNLIKGHNYYPGFPREITVMRLLDPDIKKIIEDHEKKDIRDLTEFLKSIGGKKRIKDITTAADIIYRTIEVIIHETLTKTNSPADLKKITEEMTDMLCRYLFND